MLLDARGLLTARCWKLPSGVTGRRKRAFLQSIDGAQAPCGSDANDQVESSSESPLRGASAHRPGPVHSIPDLVLVGPTDGNKRAAGPTRTELAAAGLGTQDKTLPIHRQKVPQPRKGIDALPRRDGPPLHRRPPSGNPAVVLPRLLVLEKGTSTISKFICWYSWGAPS